MAIEACANNSTQEILLERSLPLDAVALNLTLDFHVDTKSTAIVYGKRVSSARIYYLHTFSDFFPNKISRLNGGTAHFDV